MSDFNKPHIDITGRVQKKRYQAPKPNMGGGAAQRIRDQHGARIRAELDAALAAADELRPTNTPLDPAGGVYVEVDLRKGSEAAGVLERKKDGVRPGATKTLPNEDTRVALFVPDDARSVLQSIIDEYTSGPLTDKDNPPKKAKVEPIEAIRQARLETFWTDDPAALPEQPHDVIWWEVWCFKGLETGIPEAAGRINCVVAGRHYWLSFPETVVIPIRASRVSIELLLFATGAIAELRRASATPVFFLGLDPTSQGEWVEELAERVSWPAGDCPAVCLLDTGVNRAHALIEPALSADDLHSVDAEWGVDDSEGHGTGMAGLALHGDLFPRLQDQSEIELSHRLESVKLLPPQGFAPHDPRCYGAVTQSAASRPEISKPDRPRVFCLAVTNDSVSGARPTTWSAAIDQAAAGKMPGDEEDAPRRLFVVSTGNAPPEIDAATIVHADDLPIEDPAQSWNALTVGGLTYKTSIDDAGYEDWKPAAEAGSLSPFTRTSVTWPNDRTAFKPDVVFEAGNRGVSPSQTEVLSLDSLALLTTGHDVAEGPLVPFAATSAAAAQGSRLAAQLMGAFPDFWPETIRALIIHSAAWTPAMLQQLAGETSMTARQSHLRRFGYGMPDYARAVASAQNHLALVAQNTIQPFRVDKGQKKFGDWHVYRLPWPKELLESLGETEVCLKLTLSYFIEPNPGRSSSIDAQRYQSHGLRFDLKRRTETDVDFLKRVNALERENPLGPGPTGSDNPGWKFGPKSVSAGSLHCDEWCGTAVELAARDIVCVKPVTGWWKNSAANCRKQGRYALIVTLSTPDTTIDLHTPIESLVSNEVGIEVQT